jgi:hypothetical protein
MDGKIDNWELLEGNTLVHIPKSAWVFTWHSDELGIQMDKMAMIGSQ